MSESNVTDRLYRKIGWRLLPLLFACYFAAYLDRVNIGFAKLQMSSALGFSESVYGLGAGVFFVGYFLLEVPSNIALHRLGARKWIARIMVTWGLLSMGFMYVRSPLSFYILRFMLGCAEAGFYPGVMLYLSYWYPNARRARATSLFLGAIPFSGILGGPVSGGILKSMDGASGWAGWQWLFLLEGIPAIVLGVIVFLYLDDRVEHAKWLSDKERELVSATVKKEAEAAPAGTATSIMRDPRVWVISFVDFCFASGLYGISFWLPTLVKAMGVADPLSVGFVSAIPWVFGVVAMYLIARSADQKGERRWHASISAMVGAIGLLLSVLLGANPVLSMAGLSIATMGIMACLAVLWAMPAGLFRGVGAAAAIALINSFGNLSGFSAPYMVGIIKDTTHSTNGALHALAILLVAGSVVLVASRSLKRTQNA